MSICRWRTWPIHWLIFLVLFGSLTFSAMTVNKERLRRVDENRYWELIRIWNERGFVTTFGTWLHVVRPTFYQNKDDTPGLYAYSHSGTGFLIPIYLVEKMVILIRGRPSAFLFQIYSQIVVLVGAFFMAMLSARISLRHCGDHLFAYTLAVSAGLVFQNFIHNLNSAKEIYPSTVGSVLLIVIVYLRERYESGSSIERTWIGALIGFAIFWMAFSNVVVIAGFYVGAVGLLSMYGIGPKVSLREWLRAYMLPVVVAYGLVQGQLLLAQIFLNVPAIGTSVLMRMGLKGLDSFKLGGHWMILTHGRDKWAWFGFAGLALVGLFGMLITLRDPKNENDSKDMAHVLSLVLTYLFFALAFSELVVVHPYIFDVFLIIPSILVVIVYGPLILRRYYHHPRLIALGVLVFSVGYVWVSLVDYAIMVSQ